MPEAVQMRWLLASLGLLIGFVWLYVRGGRSHRILRWLVGGLWFAGGANLLAWGTDVWAWPMLLGLAAYPASLSLGYGGTHEWEKLRRRLLYGLAVGSASGAFLLPLGLWYVWGFQIVTAIACSVFFGLANPASAVGEEGVISLGMVFMVPFMLIQ